MVSSRADLVSFARLPSGGGLWGVSLPRDYSGFFAARDRRAQKGSRDTAIQLTIACDGGFPRPDEVGAKNVEAQAHRAINDDCLFGVFAHLSIQRDDEHLSLRLWCPTSKPICDLPRAMNCQERDFCGEGVRRRRRFVLRACRCRWFLIAARFRVPIIELTLLWRDLT